MDIKIEVVGKEEELEFPYVVELQQGLKVEVFSYNERDGGNFDGCLIGKVIESDSNNVTKVGKFSTRWAPECITKRYKILEANYKLKEV